MASPAADPRDLQTDLQRFLRRALSGMRWAIIGALLVITFLQPTASRVDLPTWTLIVLFAGYNLGIQLMQRRLAPPRSLVVGAMLDLPVIGVLYFLGNEPGGPLFVLFFLAVDSAAAGMALRGALVYTGIAILLAAGTDLVWMLVLPTPGDVRMLVARMLTLALVGVGMAIVSRRLVMEYAAHQAVQTDAAHRAELEHLRTTFISTMSHELRTPLTASRAALGLLETSASDRLRPDEGELLSNARRNTERLTIYIDDLLSFNEIEAGMFRLDREELDLRTVITDSLSAIYPLILQKGQTLEIVLPERLPCLGDARQLEQVVVNVLSNAQRHTPVGTRIALSGTVTPSEIGFVVSDTGPGIPPAELEAIFQRFHRLAAEVEGSGLGLAIARRIVDLHGGRMWAESAVGEGASFHVILARHEQVDSQ